jgi:hypothetical protein
MDELEPRTPGEARALAGVTIFAALLTVGYVVWMSLVLAGVLPPPG